VIICNEKSVLHLKQRRIAIAVRAVVLKQIAIFNEAIKSAVCRRMSAVNKGKSAVTAHSANVWGALGAFP
jgi:hypothetical protein